MTERPTTLDSAAMTAAEFRIARDHLGLPGEWLADRLGVALRTVRRWDSGASPVPAGVLVEIEEIEDETARFVAAVVESLREDGPDDDGVAWVTTYASDAAYRTEHPDLDWPASWHRAAMGRVSRELPWVRLTFVGADE